MKSSNFWTLALVLCLFPIFGGASSCSDQCSLARDMEKHGDATRLLFKTALKVGFATEKEHKKFCERVARHSSAMTRTSTELFYRITSEGVLKESVHDLLRHVSEFEARASRYCSSTTDPDDIIEDMLRYLDNEVAARGTPLHAAACGAPLKAKSDAEFAKEESESKELKSVFAPRKKKASRLSDDEMPGTSHVN